MELWLDVMDVRLRLFVVLEESDVHAEVWPRVRGRLRVGAVWLGWRCVGGRCACCGWLRACVAVGACVCVLPALLFVLSFAQSWDALFLWPRGPRGALISAAPFSAGW